MKSVGYSTYFWNIFPVCRLYVSVYVHNSQTCLKIKALGRYLLTLLRDDLITAKYLPSYIPLIGKCTIVQLSPSK